MIQLPIEVGDTLPDGYYPISAIDEAIGKLVADNLDLLQKISSINRFMVADGVASYLCEKLMLAAQRDNARSVLNRGICFLHHDGWLL